LQINVFDVIKCVCTGWQGSICPHCSFAAWPECSCGSRIRSRINLWLFVPGNSNRTFQFGSLLIGTFKIVFYTDMLRIYLKRIGIWFV
jgi:hypothetical protein